MRMRNTNIIMLGSLNKGKLNEYRALFREFPQIDFKALTDIVWNPTSLKEVEAGKNYHENAYLKGRIAHLAAKVPTISDDTGLEVEALQGRPGVRSHRYATPTGQESQDEANVKLLLSELKNTPLEKRRARFVCHLVFFVEGVELSVEETLEGSILERPRGTHGFGYDSVFLVDGTDRSLAELSLEEKNKLSHRGKALRKLMSEIAARGVKLVRP
jgi:XTP/dITP diphosphohydrolase